LQSKNTGKRVIRRLKLSSQTMLHALTLLISNEIRRELQQRVALRLAVEWIPVTWLLHSLNPTSDGVQWLLILVATPLVVCLLAPPLTVCHEKLNQWLLALNTWAWACLSQALLLVVELLTLGLVARLLGTWLG